MGTLHLIWGIIFIVGGLVGSIPIMMAFPFPYAFFVIAVFVVIGSLLIRKYDKDKKKSENS